jgi:ABC-type nitrate/sulfonate/bicarbonate transport system permease component
MSPDRGVGRDLVYATANGEGAKLVATTLISTAIGILFFSVVYGCERAFVTWKSDTL